MLTFRLTDNDGVTVRMEHPLSISIASSDDAPADSLRAVFAVEGTVPELCMIEALDGDETVFSGRVDMQSEEYGKEGRFLTVTARSIAAVLLDNEAKPQTYWCPSMRLLMKRHFEPLGFRSFIGAERVFSGQFTVSKGMSEWAVLKSFAKLFLGTSPRITDDGVIDVSGQDLDEETFIPVSGMISFRRELKNSALISEIRARTRRDSGYDLILKSEKAERSHVCRRRYVNTVDGRSGSLDNTKKLIALSDAAYERVVAECRGRVGCHVGGTLTTELDKKKYRIREVDYTMDVRGERTKIIAEVRTDEDIRKAL